MNKHFLLDDTVYWGALERLWMAPVFVIALLAVWFGFFLYKRRLALLAHPRFRLLMTPGHSVVRGVIRACLLTSALAAIFVALLQPQWGRKEQVVLQEGRDVLIALDISRSMLAQDVKPSRLAFVKMKIRKLLEKLSFERVGLILFSGSSFVQCPLTADYQTFLQFLDHVSVEAISSGTTSIGAALNQASLVFKRSANRKNKVVLLITDGEDFASDKKALSALVKKEGISVLSWGVGTPQGAPIPECNARGEQVGHIKLKDGSIAMSALNEPFLQELSQQVGGQYERVTQDDGDIARIATKLDAYEKEQVDERSFSEYHDRYPFLLACAWIALALEWMI
jgi:Ca-activated chloride channel family protein